ncbi:unnamed protein product [Diamesa hyperborea]
MNGIINLNHFCEIHGPQTIFSTQTIRNDFRKNVPPSGTCQNPCSACSSIGNKVVLVSQDKESSIMFLSSEKSIFGKEANSLKQAAMRSLSCEITANNQEGLVYFGDARGLNSLCFSFKVKDSYARGFEKLYSIVVVMKDKMFLLNTQPFLSQGIKEISKQIQDNAQKIYDTEQKQFPQRAERLNTGKASTVPPRSFQELTGESNIFAHLHSQFAWLLWAGARYFTESLTLGNPSIPALCKNDTEEGFAFIQVDKEEYLMKNFPSSNSTGSNLDNSEISYNLRTLKLLTKSNFIHLVYCSLVGIQIVIRGRPEKSHNFNRYFKDFLPVALHRSILESTKYIPTNKCKILSLSSDVPIPQNNVCRIEFMEESSDEPTIIKCPIDLPAKWPTLLTKIQRGVDEKLFTVTILDKYIKALIEEWKNKVICLSHSHDDLTKLKKTLGVQQQDDAMISHWLNYL